MMIGLGIYLPFYLSFTAFLGCIVKIVYTKVMRARVARLHTTAQLSAQEQEQREEAANQTGLVIASGLLGGESIVGVCIALIALFSL